MATPELPLRPAATANQEHRLSSPRRLALTPAALAEILLAPLAVALLHGWLSHSADTQGAFPWLWLIPLLIALRYGFASGLTSGLVLILTVLGLQQLYPQGHAMALTQTVGGLIATLVAGQYATYWHQTLQQDKLRLAYSDSRLESVTRAFYVTRISHDRLEEALITRPTSLRGALEALSRDLRQDTGDPSPFEGLAGNHLLQLLAQYCRIEEAGLYPYTGERLQSQPSASLGRPFSLDPGEPLVRQIQERAEAAYFSVDQILQGDSGEYRLVIPVVAASETRIALLVVRDMPLLAVEEENILTAAAILEYVADQVLATREAAELLRAYPDCPLAFAQELLRLSHMSQRLGVKSQLVLWWGRPGAAGDVPELIAAVRRGMDQYWQNPAGPEPAAVLALLPFSGPVAAQGFAQRIENLCQSRLGETPQALGWEYRLIPLQEDGPLELLARIQARLRQTDPEGSLV